jgi:hypothetical protein
VHEPGEGPRRSDAKERAERVLADPKHRKPKGSPEDEATRDGVLEGSPDEEDSDG